jgi:hypothetical protein
MLKVDNSRRHRAIVPIQQETEVKTAIVAMLLATVSFSSASAQLPDKSDLRAHEHRMWTAEQMINRIADKLVRWRKACDQAEYLVGQRLSEKCIAQVLTTYPLLGNIRVIAANRDPVQWAKLIDAVYQFEVEIEGPLNVLERK